MISKLVHEGMRLLPPEFAHTLGKKAMKLGLAAPGVYAVDQRTHMWPELLGRPLRNLLGLAAGFDKNGELIDAFSAYGFGFIEVGSVTYKGGPGNIKPRLFRLPKRHLLNRMGLNGDPAYKVAERLREQPNGSYLVNVAKTHDPQIMGDDAILDVLNAYNVVREYGFGTVINLSCPNTAEGRTFQDPAAARELLQMIAHAQKHSERKLPWGVKIGPDLGYDLEPLVQVCEDVGCHFYVACNTMPTEDPRFGKGGRSGPDLKEIVDFTIIKLRQIVPDHREIIACGGIDSGQRARWCETKGANAVEAYTGFVVGQHGGPRFAHTVLDEWESLR